MSVGMHVRCDLCADLGSEVVLSADVDTIRAHAFAYHGVREGWAVEAGVTTDQLSVWAVLALTPTVS